MTNLTNAQRQEVYKDVTAHIKRTREGVPVGASKHELRAFLNFLDVRLEAEEAAAMAAIPASTAKTWLLSHPSLGRAIMALVEKKRAEVI